MRFLMRRFARWELSKAQRVSETPYLPPRDTRAALSSHASLLIAPFLLMHCENQMTATGSKHWQRVKRSASLGALHKSILRATRGFKIYQEHATSSTLSTFSKIAIVRSGWLITGEIDGWQIGKVAQRLKSQQKFISEGKNKRKMIICPDSGAQNYVGT